MHGIDLSALDWTKWETTLTWAQFLTAAAWLGSILCVRSLCAAARHRAEPEEAARFSLRLLARWASTWLILSLAAGALHVIPLRASLAGAPMLWAAIAVGVLMIALHLSAWRRARRVARESLHVERVSNGWSRELSLGD